MPPLPSFLGSTRGKVWVVTTTYCGMWLCTWHALGVACSRWLLLNVYNFQLNLLTWRRSRQQKGSIDTHVLPLGSPEKSAG